MQETFMERRKEGWPLGVINSHIHKCFLFNVKDLCVFLCVFKAPSTIHDRTFRSSYRRCSKHLCWSLVFNNVAGLQPASYLKIKKN